MDNERIINTKEILENIKHGIPIEGKREENLILK